MIDQSVLETVAGFEQIVHFGDEGSGLDGYIAVHSTKLGPALGGVRFFPYASSSEALRDALRLARGMTYKAAAAGLDLGGGKAVINGDPAALRSNALFRAFGRAVESLRGSYITAEDVGTTVEDIAVVAQETSFVTGRALTEGGLGDPSPSTALGVLSSMQAALRYLDDDGTLAGRTVTVVGLGKVGRALVALLVEAGATVLVADIDQDRVAEAVAACGVTSVPVDVATGLECDVLAPCALGAVLDPAAIDQLRCRAVVGAANNQLADSACADLLASKQVVYVPDFVANAGGLIHVACERTATPLEQVREKVIALGGRVTAVLELADELGVSAHRAAESLAEQRLAAAGPAPLSVISSPGSRR